jgi:hypothetical protein
LLSSFFICRNDRDATGAQLALAKAARLYRWAVGSRALFVWMLATRAEGLRSHSPTRLMFQSVCVFVRPLHSACAYSIAMALHAAFPLLLPEALPTRVDEGGGGGAGVREAFHGLLPLPSLSMPSKAAGGSGLPRSFRIRIVTVTHAAPAASVAANKEHLGAAATAASAASSGLRTVLEADTARNASRSGSSGPSRQLLLQGEPALAQLLEGFNSMLAQVSSVSASTQPVLCPPQTTRSIQHRSSSHLLLLVPMVVALSSACSAGSRVRTCVLFSANCKKSSSVANAVAQNRDSSRKLERHSHSHARFLCFFPQTRILRTSASSNSSAVGSLTALSLTSSAAAVPQTSTALFAALLREVPLLPGGWACVQEMNAQTARELTLVLRDAGDREHHMRVKLPADYPASQPSVQVDLPLSFTAASADSAQAGMSTSAVAASSSSTVASPLCSLYRRFSTLVTSSQLFFDVADDLAQHAWILEPEAPIPRSAVHRRLALGKGCWLELTLDPLYPLRAPSAGGGEGSGLQLQIVGNETVAQPLQERLDAFVAAGEWNSMIPTSSRAEAASAFRHNLLRALQLDALPLPTHTNRDDFMLECSVCYTYKLEEVSTQQASTSQRRPSICCGCGSMMQSLLALSFALRLCASVHSRFCVSEPSMRASLAHELRAVMAAIGAHNAHGVQPALRQLSLLLHGHHGASAHW